MAVYTPLSQKDITNFLAQYEVGGLVTFKGIAEGVENTNYLLSTKGKKANVPYILTVYEKRVNPKDLPFFMALTDWLASRDIACPRPIKGKDGHTVYALKDKPAALISFLEGRGSPHITPTHMELLGELVANMHLAVEGFGMQRKNTLSVEGWQAMFERFRKLADSIAPGLEKEMARDLDYFAEKWPTNLPSGVVHADLFPDNVFFIDGNTDQPELSGVIDFYFACNDFYIYDLLICMNAWCFDSGHKFVPERAKALLRSYNQIRLISKEERDAMPIIAAGAAMRFLVTRAHDWLNRIPGALVNPKDPMEYVAKLRFHREVTDYREYGLR